MVDCESMVGVKLCDSGVVIGYQVDEFSHTWSAENFVAQSDIYPYFTGKMSTLIHFPLEPGCEDYSFLDQELKTLRIVLILSSKAPSTHLNWMYPFMKLMPCYLQSPQCFNTGVYLF